MSLILWKTAAPPAPSSQWIKTDFENISALCWRGGSLWLADWVKQTIAQVEFRGGELAVQKSYFLPQFQFTGLCFAGEYLYTCDAGQRLIVKHKIDFRLTTVESFSSPGPSPSALFWDGQFLWSGDSETGRIYKHSVSPVLKTAASYPSAAVSPVGIFIDGEFLWTADSRTKKIYRQKIGEGLIILESWDFPELSEGDNPLSAFTMRDGKVIAAKERVGAVIQLNPDSSAPSVHPAPGGAPLPARGR